MEIGSRKGADGQMGCLKQESLGLRVARWQVRGNLTAGIWQLPLAGLQQVGFAYPKGKARRHGRPRTTDKNKAELQCQANLDSTLKTQKIRKNPMT